MLLLPAGREASPGVRASRYARHRPERILLYQLVEEYYPAFKAQLSAQGVACSALNLNIHFHMLFLDGAYVDNANGSSNRFQWVKAPSREELVQLMHSLTQRIGRFLERQGHLERLCRYVSRPVVSEKRLSVTLNGNIRYQLKTPYKDSTTHVILEPMDFMARLAALVPKRRVNLTRFHGVFAANSKHRAWVTPATFSRSTQ